MSRKYLINDVEYPSVTTILGLLDKPFLLFWAANLTAESILNEFVACEDELGKLPDNLEQIEKICKSNAKAFKTKSTEAMDIGSQIHNLIENHIKGNKLPKNLSKEVENGFNAFLKWETDNIKGWLSSEETVHHNWHCYAGTLDAIAILKNNKTYVIDFKSSSGFYEGYDMQIAAYRFCAEGKIDGMGILRLDKETGIPEWKDFSKCYDKKLNAFIKLTDYYYAAAKRRLKNNPRSK